MSPIDASDMALLTAVCQKIFDKKGRNILTLDVRGISSLTDFFVIAEGNVERHVQALAREVVDTLDAFKAPLCHIEGQAAGDWIVLDYHHIIVHLFTQEMREKYMLEQVWKAGNIVNIYTAST